MVKTVLNAGGTGSLSGWGIKVPHATSMAKKKKCREALTLLKLFLDAFFFQLFLRLDLVIAHFLEDSPVST